MLTLTRRPGERIVLLLEDELLVSINVAAVRTGEVRIAIDAPKGVRILRRELWEQEIARELNGDGTTHRRPVPVLRLAR